MHLSLLINCLIFRYIFNIYVFHYKYFLLLSEQVTTRPVHNTPPIMVRHQLDSHPHPIVCHTVGLDNIPIDPCPIMGHRYLNFHHISNRTGDHLSQVLVPRAVLPVPQVDLWTIRDRPARTHHRLVRLVDHPGNSIILSNIYFTRDTADLQVQHHHKVMVTDQACIRPWVHHITRWVLHMDPAAVWATWVAPTIWARWVRWDPATWVRPLQLHTALLTITDQMVLCRPMDRKTTVLVHPVPTCRTLEVITIRWHRLWPLDQMVHRWTRLVSKVPFQTHQQVGYSN